VGANACDKSTLLRGLARLLKPRAGAVLLDGQPAPTSPTTHLALTSEQVRPGLIAEKTLPAPTT
jgi:ABC-type cobalamin/Fe3+-siderophores transport system ATPase subunit